MANDTDIATLLADYVPRAEYEAALNALNELDEAHKATAAELDELRGTHTEASTRLEQLQAQTRSRTYLDKFKEIAKAAKVKEGTEEDVFTLLGIKPESDEPDVKGMESALKEFLGKKPHYLAGDPPRKRLEPGEGTSRGSYAQPEEGQFSVTRAQLRDGAWTRQNGAKVAAASEAGVLQIVD